MLTGGVGGEIQTPEELQGEFFADGWIAPLQGGGEWPPPVGPQEAGYFSSSKGPRLQPWTEIITAWRYMVRVTVLREL